MKTLKQLTIVVMLILMFTVSAFAGDIEIPRPTPPPPAAATPSDIQIPGDIGIGGTSSDPATEFALNLLQTVLSIF